MKKILKSMIVTILCAVITVTSFGTEAAYAADKTPIKITFKKKTVTLYATDNGVKDPKVSKLKKKWGKPSISKDEYHGTVGYQWTKGKTTITYCSNEAKIHEFSLIWATIEDKNASVCGVKVGMTKAAAKKILKKYGVKNNYSNLNVHIGDGVEISYGITKGKVSSIFVTAYLDYTE